MHIAHLTLASSGSFELNANYVDEKASATNMWPHRRTLKATIPLPEAAVIRPAPPPFGRHWLALQPGGVVPLRRQRTNGAQLRTHLKIIYFTGKKLVANCKEFIWTSIMAGLAHIRSRGARTARCIGKPLRGTREIPRRPFVSTGLQQGAIGRRRGGIT